MSLTVSQLAEGAGLSADTVRYYERAGLLPAPERSPAGYRLYDEDMVARLRFIKGAQRIGLRLRQIRELLEVKDRGLCPCGHTEALLGKRIAEIDREVAELRDVRRELLRLRERLPSADACPEAADPWPCEQAFLEAGR